MGTGRRPRDPRPPEGGDEDVLPLRARLRRAGDRGDVPGLPRAPGLASGAERARRRGDDQARPRARLRDRAARALPPQELLLPRPAEGLPDLAVRRAALPRRPLRRPARRRRARGRDRARAPRGGRGEERPRRRRRRAGRARRALPPRPPPPPGAPPPEPPPTPS